MSAEFRVHFVLLWSVFTQHTISINDVTYSAELPHFVNKLQVRHKN